MTTESWDSFSVRETNWSWLRDGKMRQRDTSGARKRRREARTSLSTIKYSENH